MATGFVFERSGLLAPPITRRRLSQLHLLTRGLALVAGGIVALPLTALALSFISGGVMTMDTLFFTLLGMALQAPIFLALLLMSAAGLAAWQVLWLAELARADRERQLQGELKAIAVLTGKRGR